MQCKVLLSINCDHFNKFKIFSENEGGMLSTAPINIIKQCKDNDLFQENKCNSIYFKYFSDNQSFYI